jgi:hypothetical protein
MTEMRSGGISVDWDAFISYASEDKEPVAEPLARGLKGAGLSVWYDQFELRLGDRLFRSISNGLSRSKYGVVVLSPAFFKKHWPLLELDALAQKEEMGQKVILPVWHNVTAKIVRKHSPLLADRIAIRWSDGVQTVVAAILDVVEPDRHFGKVVAHIRNYGLISYLRDNDLEIPWVAPSDTLEDFLTRVVLESKLRGDRLKRVLSIKSIPEAQRNYKKEIKAYFEWLESQKG